MGRSSHNPIKIAPPASSFAKAKVPKKATINRTPVVKQAATPAAAPAYQSYAAKLAAAKFPTLLYLAPSHALFIGTAYAGAAFCLGYAAINYTLVMYDPPDDLAAWVPYAFTGLIFLMSCGGGYLLMAPMSVIRSITAVPARAKAVAKVAGSGAKAATGTEVVASKAGKGAVTAKAEQAKMEQSAVPASDIVLELKLRRMLPILPAKVVTVRPDECALNMPVYYPVSALTPQQKQALDSRNAQLRKLEQEDEKKKSILTAPFRHFSKAMFALMKNTQRIWTRDGFLEVRAQGKKYKLDITGGWALDEGRAIDRLIKSPRL